MIELMVDDKINTAILDYGLTDQKPESVRQPNLYVKLTYISKIEISLFDCWTFSSFFLKISTNLLAPALKTISNKTELKNM